MHMHTNNTFVLLISKRSLFCSSLWSLWLMACPKVPEMAVKGIPSAVVEKSAALDQSCPFIQFSRWAKLASACHILRKEATVDSLLLEVVDALQDSSVSRFHGLSFQSTLSSQLILYFRLISISQSVAVRCRATSAKRLLKNK